MKPFWYNLEKERIEKKLKIVKQSIFLMRKEGYTLEDTHLNRLVDMRDEIQDSLRKLESRVESIIEKM